MSDELLNKLNELISLGSVAFGFLIVLCVSIIAFIILKVVNDDLKCSENYKKFNLEQLHKYSDDNNDYINNRIHNILCRLSSLEDSLSAYESRIYCNIGRIDDLEKTIKKKKVKK